MSRNYFAVGHIEINNNPSINDNNVLCIQGKTNKTRKFAQVKRMISPKDPRLHKSDASKPIQKQKDRDDPAKQKAETKISRLNEIEIKRMEKDRVGLFFEHNMQLGPPYHIIIDTNFINFSIQYKLDIFQSMMDCLLAKCIPCVTDCVVAELEKMGGKYRLALK